MQVFIRKPSIDLFAGIRVSKDTVLEYENENVKQSLKDLVFHSVTRVKGESFESVYDTTIQLKEGDVLVFEEEGRGYIKPVEEFVTIAEAIDDLTNAKGVGE
ncbi:MAG: hypothetical protein IKB02_05425 [Clostridia bacterium]|nr:hypothetical protein [Clostridia bacterium]